MVISEERDGGLASDYSVGFKCGSTVSGGPVTAIFVISAVDVYVYVS